MVLTASESAKPDFRLNETVTAGSWPRWFTLKGIVPGTIFVTALKGTRTGVAGSVGERPTSGVVGEIVSAGEVCDPETEGDAVPAPPRVPDGPPWFGVR